MHAYSCLSTRQASAQSVPSASFLPLQRRVPQAHWAAAPCQPHAPALHHWVQLRTGNQSLREPWAPVGVS